MPVQKQGRPQKVVLPGCPRCRKPLVITKQGEVCPACGYRRISKDA